ncbi:hypothetical protein BSKO_11223 [Bryopsis sp. KO-2023]|nr:hypothetical protein BSKO_11223 [Bryopsis sp. KO-2023]
MAARWIGVWWRLLFLAVAAFGQTDRIEIPGRGDECGSGQEFPVVFNGATLVGCTKFGADNWCRREDSTFVICPSLPMESDSGSEDSPVRSIGSSPGIQVVVTEVMVINDGFVDEDGETSDWLELHNRESESVNLQGWSLTDDPEEPRKWTFPSIDIGPEQYIIIFASGKDKTSDIAVHTNFRMKSDGEYVGLVRPDGTIASAIANEYPRQIPNVSYGIPNYPDSEVQFTFLNEPTPGEPNSGPLEAGPFISSVEVASNAEMPPAGEDLTVKAIVTEHLSEISSVSLVYKVMYGEDSTMPMTKSGINGYVAVIPASAFVAGDMVRWYVTTTDVDGNTSRDPPFQTLDFPQYYGTVIRDASLESSLPTLYWFTSDPEQAITVEGFRGSVFFNGVLYDNVFTRRRGVTSLSWPKPKIKFDFKGKVFKYKKGMAVEEFNLQSFYDEPGEDSYLREPAAFKVMRDAGVPASESFHIRVNQNGAYFGLFAFVEQVADSFLERYGFSVAGPMFKAIHGELSNLRWDVQQGDLQWAYRKGNRKELDEWNQLYQLNQGLAGGGPIPRSKFIFDYLNLPEIINYMAVSNLLLNQDRCTKNFYLYRNPSDQRWSIFPWDLEGSFGISNGLGGEPAPDYCVLNCEQWNSPLYCDSEHPQDLAALANLDIKTGRKLMQPVTTAPAATGPVTPAITTYRVPSPEVYDEDRTGGPSPSGADGTFNHLEDAILDWPVTREMYLRRLRSLIDQFYNGKIDTILKDLWAPIQGEAQTDNGKWALTTDPGLGIEQLLTEQIPKRKQQLLVEYGPTGAGLVPGPQPNAPPMAVTLATSSFVQISNPNDFAVDMSNWVISGDTNFKFPPGTVVIAGGTVYVTPNVNTFRNRETSPKGGEGHFFLGPSSAISGGSFSIVNQQGKTV